MIIRVDYREKKLLKLLESYKTMYEYKHIKLEVVNLELGDFIICDDLGRENVIFERKSLSDLASSIKDGRYAEQSFRLNNYNFHNHNIVYIIEGDMRYWTMKGGKFNKMPIKTFYTTILSLQYYKGFSVMRTLNTNETAEYILHSADKISRSKNKCYSDTSGNKTRDIKDYANVVNKVKKKNITPDNIGEILLSQLPGISSSIAKVIIKKFGTLYKLIKAIDDDPKCLNDIKIDTRKLSSTCKRSILEYFLDKKTIIKVST